MKVSLSLALRTLSRCTYDPRQNSEMHSTLTCVKRNLATAYQVVNIAFVLL